MIKREMKTNRPDIVRATVPFSRGNKLLSYSGAKNTNITVRGTQMCTNFSHLFITTSFILYVITENRNSGKNMKTISANGSKKYVQETFINRHNPICVANKK